MNPQLHSPFHLIVESVAPGLNRGEPGAAGALTEKSHTALPIPYALSFLCQVPDAAPRITAAKPEEPTGALAIEPVALRDGQPCLLLVNSAAARLRVNDGPVPRVTLLHERDQFQFDDSPLFHVAIFQRPQTGPPPADKIGKPCPICLTTFAEDPTSICYKCQCGTVLHLQDPAGLECARAVRACPHCHQPVSLKEGYAWLPNLEW